MGTMDMGHVRTWQFWCWTSLCRYHMGHVYILDRTVRVLDKIMQKGGTRIHSVKGESSVGRVNAYVRHIECLVGFRFRHNILPPPTRGESSVGCIV